MVRRINAPSSSRLLFTVLCLMLCAVFAQAQSSESSQQRSTAGSTFVVAPTVPLAAAPTSVAAGDLNGDGKLDLVVTTKGSGSVTVLLGDGKGGFAAGVEYAAGKQPGNALLADLSGTGRLDVVVTDSATGAIELLRGNGDGTLEKPIAFPAIANPVAMAIGNFSGKGKTDLAIASKTGLAVLLNDGTGHFTSAAGVSLTHSLNAVASADLKGEGHDDLVAANADGTITVFEGDGKGGFHALAASKVASGPLSAVVSGDFNRDGRADLAVALANSGKLTVLLGCGDGSFEPGTAYRVGNNPASIAVADLKGDGGSDLITANAAANTFSVLLGKGDGAFRTAVDFAAGRTPSAIAAGDFYGTGHADLAILNAGDGTISLPLGHGDGTFHAAPSYRTGLEQKAIAAGDLNGDGLPDLVVTNFCGEDAACKSSGTVTVMLANRNGTYREGATYELGSGPVAVALADLNGDKKLDLVAVSRNDKTLTVMPGKGNGRFGEAQIYSLAASPRALYVGDFNGDGRPDLAIATDCGRSACSEPGSVDIWLGGANGKLAISASHTVGFSPVSIAAGDLRGTGHLDLVVANACGADSSCKAHGTASLLKGDGKGKFTDGGEIELGSAPSSIAIGNLTGKGLDLVVAERGSDQIALLHSDGKGGFGGPVTYKAGVEPAALAIADFDGDGHLDVAVANFKDSTVSVLRGTAKGSLRSAVNYPVGTGPESMVSVSGGKSGVSGLVTANGNGGANPMGTDITVLRDALTASQTVLQTPSPNTSTVDEQVTLTAVASPMTGGGTITDGNIEFEVVISGTPVALSDCGGTAGLAVDATGTASCTTQMLPAAISPATTITLQAAYLGDGTTYSGSTSTSVTQTVSAAATQTVVTLVTGTDPSTVNTPLKFTATISVTPAPTVATDVVQINGTVTFTNGGTTPIVGCTTAQTVVFNATTGIATASCSPTVASFGAGAYSINAQFTATDANNAASSGSLAQTVDPEGTMTTEVASATPTVDKALNITATVTPTGTAASVPLTGNVTFTGTIPGCGSPAPMVIAVSFAAGKGTAICPATAATLSATGSPYTVTAAYSADPSYSTSTSTALPVTVAEQSTTTKLTGSPNPSTTDVPVTLTATVAPPAGVTGSLPITGNVTFSGTAPGCGAPDPVLVGVTFSGGVATATCTPTASALTVGDYTTTAAYTTDGNYQSSTSTLQTQVVGKAATTTTISSSSNPAPLNTAFTLTATITTTLGNPLSVSPGGTVTFSDTAGSIPGCTSAAMVNVVAGVATATCSPTASSLTSGTLKITAVYTGDGNYSGSTSAQFSQTINAQDTTTTLSSSASPSVVDQPVTITATIAPTTGTPTVSIGGTVTFTQTSGSIPGCTGTANVTFAAGVGTATCTPTVSSLVVGTYTITAKYSGDASYNTSTSTAFPQVVNQASTTTAVSSSSPTSSVDGSLTFTATVSPVSFTGVVPITGTAIFSADGNTIAACNSRTVTFSLANGVGTATCTTTLLTAAVHGITAIYSGNTNYLGSPISPPTSVTVSLGNSATSVSALPTSSTVDQSVAITGVVVPSPAVALAANVVPFSSTGTLAFFDGVNPIANCGAVNLTYNAAAGNASATCLTSALQAATSPHSLNAKYSGDTNYNASNSAGLTFNVVKSGSTTTLTSSSNPAPVNASVIFTATVAPFTGSAAVGISGNVEFLSGGTPITGCTAQGITFSTTTLVGTATCNTQFLASPTAYSITAVYLGDSNYSTSTSTALLESVGKTSAITSLATLPVSGTSAVNQAVTFTESVTSPTVGGAAPGGTVTFTNNGNTIVGCTALPIHSGASACTTTLLSAGVHTIEATYSGDTNYAITTNTSIQTVTAIASAVATVSSSGTPPVPTVVNQTVTFTATVTPAPSATRVPLTGNVAFADNGNPLAGCVPQFNSTTGIATCTDTTLLPGPHSIVATYSGDISYTTGSSTALVQQVNPATATVALISSTNPSGVNQSVTFTATVSAVTQPIGLSGNVSFTDNGNPITACPATKVSNIGVATCTTAALTQGTHTIAASYGSDTNFTATAPATVTQTVEAAFTTTLLASSVPTGTTSTVDSPVTLTATVSSAKGSALLSGSVDFTYNAGTIAGCSAIKVNSAGVAVCPTSALVAGSDVIVATYGHDTSFSGSSATVTLTVNQASTTLTMVPQGTILVANPKGINDTVTFTATITSPAFASAAAAAIPLAGKASFADNDVPIPGCTDLPINAATGTAICTTSALGGGSDTILATYQGDPNYIAASGTIKQLVSDYSLALFTTPPVVITQGFTTLTDPIAPKTITLAPTPISGYSGELNLTCTVTATSAASGATVPGCTLPTPATLAIAPSGVQQSVPIIIDATNASPGIFSVQVIGTDQHNGLTHNLALPLQVSVSSTNSLTVISGATTNNTGSVKFVLPAGVGLSAINCLSVSGPTLSTSVKPSALNMSCIIIPDTISKSGSTQEVSVSVTVDTGSATTSQLAGHSTILTAGLLGVPVLVLIGLVRRRRFAFNGAEIFRLLAIFAIVVGGLQAIGCGGSFKRVTTGVSGQTPPGAYDLLIQGTGTDGNNYEAVLKVNVTL